MATFNPAESVIHRMHATFLSLPQTTLIIRKAARNTPPFPSLLIFSLLSFIPIIGIPQFLRIRLMLPSHSMTMSSLSTLAQVFFFLSSYSDALQQARLTSVLEQRHIIEQELQHREWKGQLDSVLQRYHNRRAIQHRIPQKYQPVRVVPRVES